MEGKDIYDRIFKQFLDTISKPYLQQQEGDEADEQFGAGHDDEQHVGCRITKDETRRRNH